MDVLLALVLLTVPLLSAAVVGGPPWLMWSRGQWSPLPVAMWVAAVALLGVWVEAETRAGIRADETGTSENIFDLAVMGWWWAASAAGAASGLLVARRPLARGRAEARLLPPTVLAGLVLAVLASLVLTPLAAAVPALLLVGVTLWARTRGH